MIRLSGFSIRQRLSGIGLLSGLTALVCASLVFLLYDAYTFRAAFVRRIMTEAEIVGVNSVSALLFDDAEAAANTLAGWRAEPAVNAATLSRADGGPPLARYSTRAGADAARLSEPLGTSGHRFDGGHLLVSKPVIFEGRTIGLLAIQADLGELRERQYRYLVLALLVLVGSLGVSIASSRVVERGISRPLQRLAAAARDVAIRGDYSVRVPVESADEIGTLVANFNDMLGRLRDNQTALQEAHSDLERRVADRTQELAAANQELEAFSYSVSHDLRAPLRAIDGFSKALLAGYDDRLDEKGRHYLRRVRAGTQRMGQLIGDMLGLARLSRREMVMQSIDVSELAEQVVNELRSRDPDRAVETAVTPGLRAQADPHLVTIVLENLIGNAWKFTAKRDGARVAIDGLAHGDVTVFSVADNGAGFDMTYADKLFGAFQRLHTEADFEGTGIGLATVQRIVARHGGRIWAEGVPDQGAVFHFTLVRDT
jgi:signal transduction histidine kinase